jgi:integrase
MKLNLYKRKSALWLSLSQPGRRKRIGLGISTEYPVEKNLVQSRSKAANEINMKLLELYAKIEQSGSIEEAVKIVKAPKKKPEGECIFDWCVKKVDTMSHLREGTIKMYKSMLQKYKEYVGSEDLSITECDMYSVVDIRSRRELIRKVNAHWNGWAEFMTAHISPSTTRHYLSKMKALMSQLERTEGIKIPFNANVEVKSVPPVSWPVDFTQEFIEKKSRNPAEVIMKLQILTCARPGDLLSIKREDFKREGSMFVVEGVSEKTNSLVRPIIPEWLWRAAKELCNPYVVPGYDKQAKYDRYRKMIDEVLAEYSDIEIDVYKQEGNKVVRYKSNLQQATTPHVLRKSGINYYRRYLDDETIKARFSGHTNDSAYRKHYVSFDENQLKKLPWLKES